jgi:hypothetical protein
MRTVGPRHAHGNADHTTIRDADHRRAGDTSSAADCHAQPIADVDTLTYTATDRHAQPIAHRDAHSAPHGDTDAHADIDAHADGTAAAAPHPPATQPDSDGETVTRCAPAACGSRGSILAVQFPVETVHPLVNIHE